MCERLLGVVPPDSELIGVRIRMRFLEGDAFRQLPADVDARTIARHARAHLLRLICGVIFSDVSGSYAHLMFLSLLEDFGVCHSYSLGSATLAWLYREMCCAAHHSKTQIAGPLRLLQFLWMPYTVEILANLPPDYADESDLWVARVPLICFHIIEW
ncbi:serine/threonine-protein phosphatase 7 long form homolog [Malania oleifera]|uniref:serine/threonine-protein phosphatase 7 long form homolog n=1 Tax=Malania oleifera TaxID=397392 RepID=UPI0025AE0D6E|nr:serine/threonine-protein phosphatase 7 long form homolog [Malania oleifera]